MAARHRSVDSIAGRDGVVVGSKEGRACPSTLEACRCSLHQQLRSCQLPASLAVKPQLIAHLLRHTLPLRVEAQQRQDQQHHEAAGAEADDGEPAEPLEVDKQQRQQQQGGQQGGPVRGAQQRAQTWKERKESTRGQGRPGRQAAGVGDDLA